MEYGKFVVLLGIDGAGKSTVLEELRRRGTPVVSWQMTLGITDLRHAYGHPDIIAEYPMIRAKLRPRTRALEFLMFYAAMYEYLIEPTLHEGKTIVADSYFYKQLAKEEVEGRSHPLLFQADNGLPEPDHVIFLDVPPEVAYRRKRGEVSVAEAGEGRDEAGFVGLQRELAKRMDARTAHLTVSHIDAARLPPAALAEQVAPLIGDG
jgi:thymidylate kinase